VLAAVLAIVPPQRRSARQRPTRRQPQLLPKSGKSSRRCVLPGASYRLSPRFSSHRFGRWPSARERCLTRNRRYYHLLYTSLSEISPFHLTS
jgi:hypothetical protein